MRRAAPGFRQPVRGEARLKPLQSVRGQKSLQAVQSLRRQEGLRTVQPVCGKEGLQPVCRQEGMQSLRGKSLQPVRTLRRGRTGRADRGRICLGL